jgi:lipopolysaccharide biosynthesis regulator YciM
MSAADILLGGGVAAVLVFLGLLVRNRSGPRRSAAATVDTYALALSALINGNRREALRLFKETVQSDSTNVDAYIRLGDLLRESGETARALAIHRELMVRSALLPSDRARILESLTRDYLSAGRHEEAGETAEKLRSLDKRNRFAPAALQEVAEELGDWNRALKVLEGRLREGGEMDKALLARYRGYVGSRELSAGHRKEARHYFQ